MLLKSSLDVTERHEHVHWAPIISSSDPTTKGHVEWQWFARRYVVIKYLFFHTYFIIRKVTLGWIWIEFTQNSKGYLKVKERIYFCTAC